MYSHRFLMLIRRPPFPASALSLVFLAVSVYPQTLPSKGEANKLLQKAIESQNLQSAGKPPFHLVAHVRYNFLGETSDGVYEILWAAPDRFRETYQLGRMTETDVALGDKIHISRNTPTCTPQLLHLRN